MLLDLALEGRFDFVRAFYFSSPLRALLSAEVDTSVPFIHWWTVREFLPRLTDRGFACYLPFPSPREFRHYWGLRRLLDSNTMDEDFRWLREERAVSFWGPNELWGDYMDTRFDLQLGFQSFGGVEVPEPDLRERLWHLIAWLNCMAVPGTRWGPLRTADFLFPAIQDPDGVEREARHVVVEEVERAGSEMSWWRHTFGGELPIITKLARARFEQMRDRVLERLLVLDGGISRFGDDPVIARP